MQRRLLAILLVASLEVSIPPLGKVVVEVVPREPRFESIVLSL